MTDVTFDHIGIAVESIDKALAFFEGVLGLTVTETEEVPAQGVRVAKLHTGKTTVELLEPLDESSPIRKHIDKRGEGIHHICFGTSDAAGLAGRAKEAGFQPLSDELRPGASGKQVVFFDPKTTFRTLIELAQ